LKLGDISETTSNKKRDYLKKIKDLELQRGMKWQEVGENSIIRSFMTCTLRQLKSE
jgi:hypothetical protein